jgi:hypothetical protein
MDSEKYIGLDVHQATIVVAVMDSAALHTPNACRKVRAKKSAIGCFIRQPAYRRQSQVNRRRGVRVLFERDSVPCDHGPVEG